MVTLLCDAGERYRDSYFDDNWLAARDLGCGTEQSAVAQWIADGRIPPDAQRALLSHRVD